MHLNCMNHIKSTPTCQATLYIPDNIRPLRLKLCKDIKLEYKHASPVRSLGKLMRQFIILKITLAHFLILDGVEADFKEPIYYCL